MSTGHFSQAPRRAPSRVVSARSKTHNEIREAMLRYIDLDRQLRMMPEHDTGPRYDQLVQQRHAAALQAGAIIGRLPACP